MKKHYQLHLPDGEKHGGLDGTENNVISVRYTMFSVSCDTGKISGFGRPVTAY